jgi:hypothetical protein
MNNGTTNLSSRLIVENLKCKYLQRSPALTATLLIDTSTTVITTDHSPEKAKKYKN